MRHAILVLVIAIAAVLLGSRACSTGGESGSWTISMTEMRFSPNRIDAKVGQPLTIRLVNQGAQRHDLAFQALHMPSLSGVETALEPGQSTTITLRFDEPGTHTFICTIPGHFAAGMSGAVFVRE